MHNIYIYKSSSSISYSSFLDTKVTQTPPSTLAMNCRRSSRKGSFVLEPFLSVKLRRMVTKHNLVCSIANLFPARGYKNEWLKVHFILFHTLTNALTRADSKGNENELIPVHQLFVQKSLRQKFISLVVKLGISMHCADGDADHHPFVDFQVRAGDFVFFVAFSDVV